MCWLARPGWLIRVVCVLCERDKRITVCVCVCVHVLIPVFYWAAFVLAFVWVGLHILFEIKLFYFFQCLVVFLPFSGVTCIALFVECHALELVREAVRL